MNWGDLIMKDVKVILENGAIMPSYAKQGDSGVDLFCYEDVIIPAQARGFVISTGIRMELPSGYELQVRPKSGVSSRTSIRVILGTVDEGYRGVIGIMVDNLSDELVIVEKGRAIAQGVLQAVPKMNFIQVEEFETTTDRGNGGFGSTGRGL